MLVSHLCSNWIDTDVKVYLSEGSLISFILKFLGGILYQPRINISYHIFPLKNLVKVNIFAILQSTCFWKVGPSFHRVSTYSKCWITGLIVIVTWTLYTLDALICMSALPCCSTLPSLDAPYPMLVLAGPQACGKQELAHRLCRQFSTYFRYG